MAAARILLLAALAMALWSGTARAERLFLPLDQEGAWTRADRQVHFGGSLAIAASLRIEGRSRATAVAGSFTVGIAKEIYDAAWKPRRLGRGVSRKDLAADLLGAFAGVLLVAAIDRGR